MTEPMAKLSEQKCDLINGDLNRSVEANKSDKIGVNYEMKSLVKSNSNNNCENSPQKCDNQCIPLESQPKDSTKKSFK